MSERSFQSFLANGADIYSKPAKYALNFPKTFCQLKSVSGHIVTVLHSFFHLWSERHQATMSHNDSEANWNRQADRWTDRRIGPCFESG